MSEVELWTFEKEFWTGDAALYEARLASPAAMVLPQPAGIMERAQIVESLRDAPRWSAVEFADRRELRPVPGVAVLIYGARARREGDRSDYRARCSSTYVADGGRWLLVLHHQTAIQ